MKKSFLKIATVLGIVAIVMMSTKCNDDPKPISQVVKKDTNLYVGDTMILQLGQKKRIIDSVKNDTFFMELVKFNDSRCSEYQCGHSTCEFPYFTSYVQLITKNDTIKQDLTLMLGCYDDSAGWEFDYKETPTKEIYNYKLTTVSIFPKVFNDFKTKDKDYKVGFRLRLK